MESFSLVFRGRLLDGADPEKMPAVLKSLKFSEKHIQHAREGKPLTLKRGLNSVQVLSLKKKLASHGLQTHAKLVLTPECLSLGLKELKNNTSSNFGGVGEVQAFENRAVNTKIVSIDGRFAIKSEKNIPVGRIRRHGIQVSAKARVVLAMLLMVPLQSYLLRFLSQEYGSGLGVTVLGVLFLLLGVIILPQLLRCLSVAEYFDGKDRLRCSVVDLPTILPNKLLYKIYGGDGIPLANICIKKSQAVCASIDGRMMFAWSLKKRISNDKDVVSSVADSVLDDSIYGQISDYYEGFRQIISFFSRSPKLGAVEFPVELASPIVDEKGRVVAGVYHKPIPAIRIMDSRIEYGVLLQVMAALSVERPLI